MHKIFIHNINKLGAIRGMKRKSIAKTLQKEI